MAMVRKSVKKLAFPAVMASLALAAANVSLGAAITGTWKNIASGGVWSDANNWTLSSGSVAPGVAGDIAQYTDGNYNATTNLDSSLSLGQLTTAGGRATWIINPTVGANTITMDNGASAAIIAAPYRARLIVNPNIVVSTGGLAISAGTQASASGAAVTINGSITGTGNVTLDTSTVNSGTAIYINGLLNNSGTISVGGTVGSSTLMNIGSNVTKFTKTGASGLVLGSNLSLTAANGSTIGDGTNAMTLSLVGGTLSVAGGAQHIATNVTASFAGGELAYSGATSDTIAAIAAPGQGTLTVSGGATLNATTWTVPTTGGILFRGIGQGVTDSVGFVKFGTAPTLTGNIIPQAYGDTSVSGTGAGFVTYDATNGVRLLNDSDYSSTLAAGTNVSLGASTASSVVTINSLRLTTGGGITGTNTITLTTGNLLSTAASASIAAPLSATTLFATTIGDLTISSNFGGTNLVKNGAGKLTLSALSSTTAYTGTTTVNGGVLVLSGTGGNRLGNITVNNGATAQLGVNNMLSDGATITVNAGGTFDYNGKLDTVSTVAGTGTVTGGTGATGTLRFSQTGTSTVNNVLTGNLNIEARGAGTTIFANPLNAYTGYTQTQAGATIKIAADNALPTGTSLQLGASGETGTTGTFDLNGNNQTVGSLIRNTTGTATVTNSLTIMRTFTVSSNSLDSSFSGIISSANLALAKSGSKTLTLSGANTYGGATTITGGSLLVNGTNSGTGAYTVVGAATLGGSGSIAGKVGVSGYLTPGASAGTVGKLTITSTDTTAALDMSSGGTYLWTMGALKDNATGTAGTDFSQISLTGTGGNLKLGGTSQVTLSFVNRINDPNSGNPFWNSSHSWTIIAGTGTTNIGDTNMSSITNASWSAGSFTTLADSSGNLTLNYVTIPEPVGLSVLGIAGMLILGRRRRQG